MGLSQTGKFSPRTTGRAMKWESKRVSGAKKKEAISIKTNVLCCPPYLFRNPKATCVTYCKSIPVSPRDGRARPT